MVGCVDGASRPLLGQDLWNVMARLFRNMGFQRHAFYREVFFRLLPLKGLLSTGLFLKGVGH